MKRLLILTNPDSKNTALVRQHPLVMQRYEIEEVDHFDIVNVTPSHIVTKTATIALEQIDAIWFEFDWDLANPNRHTHHFSAMLYTYHAEKFVYNAETLKRFHPLYDSKMFNAAFLDYHGIAHPRTVMLTASTNLNQLTFPKVLKKDMSGRARDVKRVSDVSELSHEIIESAEWILQDLIAVKQELRVIVRGTEVIGSVDKTTKFKDGTNQKVRVTAASKNLSSDVVQACESVARKLHSDLVGIDVVVDDQGAVWIIEFNIGASIGSFMKHTGIDLIEMLFDRR